MHPSHLPTDDYKCIDCLREVVRQTQRTVGSGDQVRATIHSRKVTYFIKGDGVCTQHAKERILDGF
jgi:hypothetical protein